MSSDAKTIFRSKHRRNYTVVSNEILYNPGLSGKAKWILMYLLSKPEDWQTNISDIVNHGTDGRDAVLSGIKELKAAGYLKKVRVICPDTKRVVRWETHVFDEPQPELQNTEKPHVENPPSGSPQSGKADTTKYSDLQSTESNNHLRLRTTTKDESGSSSKKGGASLSEPEPEAKQVDEVGIENAQWLLSTIPLLGQHGVRPTEKMALVCSDKSRTDLWVAALALLQYEETGRLRDAQRYLEDAIANRWIPSAYWVKNGAPMLGFKLGKELINYIESIRATEEASLTEVSA